MIMNQMPTKASYTLVLSKKNMKFMETLKTVRM